MIVLVSVAQDVERMNPVRDDPEVARAIIEILLDAPVLNCVIATHSVASDDYLVDLGDYDFPAESIEGRVATVARQGVGAMVVNLDWEDHSAPTVEPEPAPATREVVDYEQRAVHTVDSDGVVLSTRPFTAEENAAADARDAQAAAVTLRESNRAALSSRVGAALTLNNQFLAIVDPTPEQIADYLPLVARQLNGLLRIISGALDDVSDTF